MYLSTGNFLQLYLWLLLLFWELISSLPISHLMISFLTLFISLFFYILEENLRVLFVCFLHTTELSISCRNNSNQFFINSRTDLNFLLFLVYLGLFTLHCLFVVSSIRLFSPFDFLFLFHRGQAFFNHTKNVQNF